MEKTYLGIGVKSDEKQLLEVLDDVFFRDENTTFLGLLPKLYKDRYNCAEKNVIIKEGNSIKAAVGCFPLTAVVGDKKLKITGIGNVAVARDSRGKGYMIDAMNFALKNMFEDGTDYSLLGGQRQRYEYFGYTKSGTSVNLKINKGNIEKAFSRKAATTFTAELLTEDNPDIEKINELNKNPYFYIERPVEDTVDILKSWRNIPYAVYDGDEFKGYFVTGGGAESIEEIKAVNNEDFIDILLCAMDIKKCDDIEFGTSLQNKEICDLISKTGNTFEITSPDMFNIINYGRVIDAFLCVKAKRYNLGSGTLKVLIHGCKRDENLEITVDGEKVTVKETEEKPDIELNHLDAIAFFASNYSPDRFNIPAFAQNWFPLEIYMCSQDGV